MKNIIDKLSSSWKTALGGFCMFICMLLYLFKAIDERMAITATGMIATIVAFLSKDFNVTGNSDTDAKPNV